MKAPKNSTFQDRLSVAANARKAMIERFRAQPGPDDAGVIEQRAEQARVAAAREIRTAERKAARAAEAARLAAEQAANAAAMLAKAAELKVQEADAAGRAQVRADEQKAARDLRYAARQARRR